MKKGDAVQFNGINGTIVNILSLSGNPVYEVSLEDNSYGIAKVHLKQDENEDLVVLSTEEMFSLASRPDRMPK